MAARGLSLTLRRAGADNVAFNAPLGPTRALDLADRVIEHGATKVVDLGCGRGELARLIARRGELVTVTGVENDPYWVHRARDLTARSDLDDRIGFELADAATWDGDVDAVVAVGVSHAFGGLEPMLTRLVSLLGSGVALVGEGVWESDPDAWCRDTFGDLPRRLDGITQVAGETGWTVDHADLSTELEWDDFERDWVAGIRALGTPEADSFADEREDEYRRYRGVLGFAWLRLRPAVRGFGRVHESREGEP